MGLMKYPEALEAIATSLGTRVDWINPKAVIISGKDVGGQNVSIIGKQETLAVDYLQIRILRPTDSQLVMLVGGEERPIVDADGTVKIRDVKDDRFAIGPKLAAVIEFSPKRPELS